MYVLYTYRLASVFIDDIFFYYIFGIYYYMKEKS